MRTFLNALAILPRLSFRKKIFFSLIVLSLILIVYMGIASFRFTSDIVLDMGMNLSERNFDNAYKSLERYFANIEKYSTLLLRMPGLREIISADDAAALPNSNVAGIDRSVREIINLASATDAVSFDAVDIFTRNEYSFTYYDQVSLPFHDYRSCMDYYSDKGYLNNGYQPPVWCDIIKTQDAAGKQKFTFINFRVLYDPVTFDVAGILLLGVNESDLGDNFFTYSANAFIMHRNGLIISHSNKALLGTGADENIYRTILDSSWVKDTVSIAGQGNTRLITYRRIAGNDAFFVVPFDYYSGQEVWEAGAFRRGIIALAIVGVGTAFIFAFLLSRGLSSSVLDLKDTVQAVHAGDLSARFITNRRDEVAYLGERFNEMMEQINVYIQNEREQEKIKTTLELRLMQSQINPHLLYNTLDSLMWALESQKIEQVRSIIISLSEFFKISLSGGMDIITLRRELELVQNYIALQRTARGKSIIFNNYIPEEMLEMSIVKLSLQPIAENSIIHGFSGYRDDGVITITLESFDDGMSYVILMEDNGIGIHEQKLAYINDMLDSKTLKTHMEHFGLYNVHRRLKAFFGENSGLHFESELGSYTRVFVKVSMVPSESKEVDETV